MKVRKTREQLSTSEQTVQSVLSYWHHCEMSLDGTQTEIFLVIKCSFFSILTHIHVLLKKTCILRHLQSLSAYFSTKHIFYSLKSSLSIMMTGATRPCAALTSEVSRKLPFFFFLIYALILLKNLECNCFPPEDVHWKVQ